MVRIKSVSIRNFRGIKTCELKDLSDINLLIGKNNSGKSTILEAIYFLSLLVKEKPPYLLYIMRRRENRTQWSVRELYFGCETTEPIKISLIFDNEEEVVIKTNNGVEIPNFIIDVLSNEKGTSRHTFNLDFRYVGSSGPRIEDIFSGEILEFLKQVTLIDDFLIHEINDVERRFLQKIKERGIDIKAMSSYRRIYDKLATNWEWIPYREVGDSRVVITRGEKRSLIGSLGQGAKHGFVIPNIALSLEDTALLIEEIEAHQHPSSIRGLVDDLARISKRNNLQLIITTHSPDVYRYIAMIPESKIYYLERPNGDVLVSAVDKSSLSILYDLGWDLNNILRFEKYVIVEGLYDMEILKQLFRKLNKKWPEDFGISIIPSRSKNKIKEIVKSLSHMGRKYFLIIDMDDKDKDTAEKEVIEAFKSLRNEGYDLVEESNSIVKLRHKQSGAELILEKNNIFVAGMPDKFPMIKQHTIEDYLIEMILHQRSEYSREELKGESSKDVLTSLLKHYDIDIIREIIGNSKIDDIPGEICDFIRRLT